VGQLRTITKITTQKRATNRFNVYLDGVYAFSISEDIYVKYHLHKGKTLTNDDIDRITDEDRIHRAYVAVIQWLSYRMRTEAEVWQYLRKKDYSRDVIAQVITRLHEKKLLDDEQFAKSFVRDRMRRSTKGPNLIKQELQQKGVPEHLVYIALQQYTKDEQRAKAKSWAEKQLMKRQRHPVKWLKQQIQAKLVQRGYSASLARDTVQSLHIERDEADEIDLLTKSAEKLYHRYSKKYTEPELSLRIKERLYARGFSIDSINQYIDSSHFSEEE